MASLLNRGSEPLGPKLAAHLLRRATYNISKTRIDYFATLNVDQALDELLDYTSFSTDDLNLPEPIAYDTGTYFVNSGSSDLSTSALQYIVNHWYFHEAKLSTTLRFKLATFLHSIFIASLNSSLYKLNYDYLSWLMYYSKESYRELAFKITYDNRMLYYLNNRSNRVGAPNENYAREFLELFTITKGPQIAQGNYTNYTELDVQQAARVLTGYRNQDDRTVIDPDTGIPTGISQYYRHDSGDKTFSEAFDSQTILGATDGDDMFRELEDFVDMIFGQEETAKVICRRMYRYFVRRTISAEVETDIIEPLATILYDNDYNIEITVRALLSSLHFYDEDDLNNSDEIIGALVRNPFDLLLQSFNLLDAEIPDPVSDAYYHYLCYYYGWHRFLNYGEMYMFRPVSVAGYKAIYQEPDYDKQWFNFNTIHIRYAIGQSILEGKQYFQPGNPTWRVTFDVVEFVENSGAFTDPSDAEQLIDEVYDLLLIEDPETFRHNYFYYDVFLKTLDEANWEYEWNAYLLTGTDTSVRGHLEDLFNAVMGSPEYQVL